MRFDCAICPKSFMLLRYFFGDIDTSHFSSLSHLFSLIFSFVFIFIFHSLSFLSLSLFSLSYLLSIPYLKKVGTVSIELTTLRLWDLRSTNWATFPRYKYYIKEEHYQRVEYKERPQSVREKGKGKISKKKSKKERERNERRGVCQKKPSSAKGNEVKRRA